MQTMSRFFAIATKGNHCHQIQTPETISRNRSRLLLVCQTAIPSPSHSGLFLSDWPEITPMMTNTMTTSHTSSVKSSFVAQASPTKYGPTKVHSSHPRPFKSLQSNEASNTLYHRQDIHKVTEKLKLRSSP